MLSSKPELLQKSVTTKQDDNNKFMISRLLLSKETPITNPSFRVYYGGLPGNVPFMWESEPGTPKNTLEENTLPPLTPPPSYYSNSFKKPSKKHSRSNLLHTLFPKISPKKNHVTSQPSSPSFSLFSSPDSSMLSAVNTRKRHGRSWFSSTSSSFDSMGDYEEGEDAGSPTSTLCFQFRRVTSCGNRAATGFS